ncbi:MAG: hypothetical protein HGA85_03625 [Nanoarchaeota archaeon]|nr:hypothetical protein [Nanoarchaeota archaeon]
MRKLFSFILMMALVIWISYAAECDTSIWLKHDQPYSYERHTITVLGSDPNGTKCGIYVNSVLKWIDVGSRQEFSDFSIAVDDAISVFTSEDVVVKEADWTCGVIIGGAVNHTFEKNAGGIFTFNGRNINAVDVGNDFTVCGIEVDGVVRWISQGDAEDFGGLEIRVLFVSGTEAVINPSYDGDECKLRIIPCECESSRECPSCVDTDSGIDSSTQGVVNARQWSGSSLASVTGVDSCVDSRILKEWSCGELHTPSGVLLIENRITCEAGCMEGVCKPRQNITVTNCILTETLDPYIKNELILWYSDGTSQEYSD